MNLLDIERPKWQGAEALPAGKHTIVFDWKMEAQGPALGRGGSGTLTVDGKPVAQRSLPRTQPIIWAWDETFDVGLDTGTPVDDADYQVPFAFTGKLHKITVDLGQTTATPEAIRAMVEEMAKKRDRRCRQQIARDDDGSSLAFPGVRGARVQPTVDARRRDCDGVGLQR
jgi:arylsulfatase